MNCIQFEVTCITKTLITHKQLERTVCANFSNSDKTNIVFHPHRQSEKNSTLQQMIHRMQLVLHLEMTIARMQGYFKRAINLSRLGIHLHMIFESSLKKYSHEGSSTLANLLMINIPISRIFLKCTRKQFVFNYFQSNLVFKSED